jgi:hypothetical protein
VNVAGRFALVLLWASATVAQVQFRTISARAGTIAYQQGSVYVDDQRVHSTSGAPPFQMKDGQQLHVDNGRVELQLGSGVYLRMLGPSSVRMQATQLPDTRVLVEDGSAIVEVAGMTKGAQLRILSGASITELRRDGLYRFDAGRLRIYSGDAAVERAGIVIKAKSGQAVDLTGSLEPVRFDLKELDPLQTWSSQRIKRRTDNEQRRLQTRLIQAARSKVDLEEHNDRGASKRAKDPISDASQP